MCNMRTPDRVCAIDAQVVSSDQLCLDHVAIELVLQTFPHSNPGQFVQMQCSNEDVVTARELEWPADGFPSLTGSALAVQAFLRRPFSIADRWDDGDGHAHVLIISRSIGTGTRWLEGLQPGDRISITGPLGRGFALPEQPRPVLLVGGGVGIPPLLYLARRLAEQGQQNVTAVLGATTGDLLPLRMVATPDRDGRPSRCVAWPGAAPFPAIVTTDDGSVGLPGRVTAGVESWYRGAGAAACQNAIVYACGPEPMLQAVAQQTRKLGLTCQLCIERRMGCGLGTCLSCVVRRREPGAARGWSWALACQDGPVFDRDLLPDYDDRIVATQAE